MASRNKEAFTRTLAGTMIRHPILHVEVKPLLCGAHCKVSLRACTFKEDKPNLRSAAWYHGFLKVLYMLGRFTDSIPGATVGRAVQSIYLSTGNLYTPAITLAGHMKGARASTELACKYPVHYKVKAKLSALYLIERLFNVICKAGTD